MKRTKETLSEHMVNNYRSKIPLKILQEMYPVVDSGRLGWALVIIIFTSGLIQ